MRVKMAQGRSIWGLGLESVVRAWDLWGWVRCRAARGRLVEAMKLGGWESVVGLGIGFGVLFKECRVGFMEVEVGRVSVVGRLGLESVDWFC